MQGIRRESHVQMELCSHKTKNLEHHELEEAKEDAPQEFWGEHSAPDSLILDSGIQNNFLSFKPLKFWWFMEQHRKLMLHSLIDSQENMSTPNMYVMFITAFILHNSPKVQTQMSIHGGWMHKKMLYTHIVKYYLAIKSNGVLIYTTSWMSLENMLREKS